MPLHRAEPGLETVDPRGGPENARSLRQNGRGRRRPFGGRGTGGSDDLERDLARRGVLAERRPRLDLEDVPPRADVRERDVHPLYESALPLRPLRRRPKSGGPEDLASVDARHPRGDDHIAGGLERVVHLGVGGDHVPGLEAARRGGRRREHRLQGLVDRRCERARGLARRDEDAAHRHRLRAEIRDLEVVGHRALPPLLRLASGDADLVAPRGQGELPHEAQARALHALLAIGAQPWLGEEPIARLHPALRVDRDQRHLDLVHRDVALGPEGQPPARQLDGHGHGGVPAVAPERRRGDADREPGLRPGAVEQGPQRG